MNNITKGIFLLVMAFCISACGDKSSESTPAPASGDAMSMSDQSMEEMPTDPSTQGMADMPGMQSGQAAADLRSKLADPSRPAEDRARDASRKPADVVAFLGIEPGMRVMDIIAAGGYYTEVLSRAVGPEGSVVSQNTEAVLHYNDGAMDKALNERLADNRLPNVTRLNKNFDEITAEDGPFDAAITAMNFHDIYNGDGPEAAVNFLKTIYTVLKPGGVLGITDHVGVAGADNAKLHRIEKSKVIDSARAAGFEVEGESDLLRNDTDDHSQTVFSEGVRGHTDRFVLKLRKPAA